MCQVILNFANNGFDAMPSGGCLTIRTYKEDEKVVLEVQDEGEGIMPELIEKIGTPFFTTKKNGTGLGIAVCTNIINQHNAKLKINSDSNGTSFQVIFNTLSS
ncbi:MAG: ATP-binding protein [Desulfosporosinus sp.]|nr:ATP-binding protein [Desulfosporosinus sp.]